MDYRFSPILAVIPARYGSKRLPGKNVRKFLGRALLAHSILFAKSLPQIDAIVVSTDGIVAQALASAYEVENLIRPAELATDDTPMWPVLQHALREMERIDRKQYGSVLLLQPTSPIRYKNDLLEMMDMLERDQSAQGVISTSVLESSETRRQEANGVFYLYLRDSILEPQNEAHILKYWVPEYKAFDINTEADFHSAELSVQSGMNRLPWVHLQQDS